MVNVEVPVSYQLSTRSGGGPGIGNAIMNDFTPRAQQVLALAGDAASSRWALNKVDEIVLTADKLACDVQNRVRLLGGLLQRPNSFSRRKYVQFDFSATSFPLHLVHDRQCSGTGTDHEPLALPRYVLIH